LRGLARRASIIATFAKTPFYMRWLTVFSKEVKENMRDRRTMLSGVDGGDAQFRARSR
jgi:hypothetical protein